MRIARKGKMVEVAPPAPDKYSKEEEEPQQEDSDDDDDANDVSSQEAFDEQERAPTASGSSIHSSLHSPDYKFGIAARLTQAVAERCAHEHVKRSPDLVPLSKQFDAMRKRLRSMISTVQRYKASFKNLDNDRMQMVEDLTTYADGSPLEAQIKDLDMLSFLAVYTDASTHAGRYIDEFQSEVIDYVIEWESVVSTRVDKEWKDVKELRKTFNHYQVKVDKLRKQVNDAEAKGKSVNGATAEKLKRNEDKLDEASTEFEAAAAPLCYLYEEVVHNAYKDLCPLVLSLMQWDSDRSYTESNIFGKFESDQLEAAYTGESSSHHQHHSSSSSPSSPRRPKSPARKDYAPQTPTRNHKTDDDNNNKNKQMPARKPYELDESEYSESSFSSSPPSPGKRNSSNRRIEQV